MQINVWTTIYWSIPVLQASRRRSKLFSLMTIQNLHKDLQEAVDEALQEARMPTNMNIFVGICRFITCRWFLYDKTLSNYQQWVLSTAFRKANRRGFCIHFFECRPQFLPWIRRHRSHSFLPSSIFAFHWPPKCMIQRRCVICLLRHHSGKQGGFASE